MNCFSIILTLNHISKSMSTQKPTPPDPLHALMCVCLLYLEYTYPSKLTQDSPVRCVSFRETICGCMDCMIAVLNSQFLEVQPFTFHWARETVLFQGFCTSVLSSPPLPGLPLGSFFDGISPICVWKFKSISLSACDLEDHT